MMGALSAVFVTNVNLLKATGKYLTTSLEEVFEATLRSAIIYIFF